MNKNEANEFFKKSEVWFMVQTWNRTDAEIWMPNAARSIDRCVTLEVYLDGLRPEYVQETIDKEVREVREFVHALIAKFGINVTVEDYEAAIAETNTDPLETDLSKAVRDICHNIIAAGRVYREAVVSTGSFADATEAMLDALTQGETTLRTIRDQMHEQDHPRWLDVSKLWESVASSRGSARIEDIRFVKPLVQQLRGF